MREACLSALLLGVLSLSALDLWTASLHCLTLGRAVRTNSLLSTERAQRRERSPVSLRCGRTPRLAFVTDARTWSPKRNRPTTHAALRLEEKAYGACVLNGSRVAARFLSIPYDHGPTWLYFGFPMESLKRAYPVGAYPFDDGSSLAWRNDLDAWLRDIGEHVFAQAPFDCALISHQPEEHVADKLAGGELPARRWEGILVPGPRGLDWYPPTGAFPFGFRYLLRQPQRLSKEGISMTSPKSFGRVSLSRPHSQSACHPSLMHWLAVLRRRQQVHRSRRREAAKAAAAEGEAAVRCTPRQPTQRISSQSCSTGPGTWACCGAVRNTTS
jgi:hypothetical protein